MPHKMLVDDRMIPKLTILRLTPFHFGNLNLRNRDNRRNKNPYPASDTIIPKKSAKEQITQKEGSLSVVEGIS